MELALAILVAGPAGYLTRTRRRGVSGLRERRRSHRAVAGAA